MSPERQHAIYLALMAARRRMAHSCLGAHSSIPVCACCHLDEAIGLLALEEVREAEEPAPVPKRTKTPRRRGKRKATRS